MKTLEKQEIWKTWWDDVEHYTAFILEQPADATPGVMTFTVVPL